MPAYGDLHERRDARLAPYRRQDRRRYEGSCLPEGASFEVQQALLEGESAAVADKFSVGADDAVARDHDRQGIRSISGADGSHRAGPAQPDSQVAVGAGLAVRNVAQDTPNTLLKIGSNDFERKAEFEKGSREVRGQLLDGCPQHGMDITVAGIIRHRRALNAGLGLTKRDLAQAFISGNQS